MCVTSTQVRMDPDNEPCRGLRSISYPNTECAKIDPMTDFPVPQLAKFLVRRTPQLCRRYLLVRRVTVLGTSTVTSTNRGSVPPA